MIKIESANMGRGTDLGCVFVALDDSNYQLFFRLHSILVGFLLHPASHPVSDFTDWPSMEVIGAS